MFHMPLKAGNSSMNRRRTTFLWAAICKRIFIIEKSLCLKLNWALCQNCFRLRLMNITALHISVSVCLYVPVSHGAFIIKIECTSCLNSYCYRSKTKTLPSGESDIAQKLNCYYHGVTFGLDIWMCQSQSTLVLFFIIIIIIIIIE